MPPSRLQIALLQLLAKNRNPESYVAGAVAINRDGPRYSRDIDIFHDSDERLAATAEEDAATIQRDGKFMQPDPGLLETYEWHRGARRGHWPTSTEIGRAMLQRHTE